ncbi:MAG: radical SAM family heme chaperone HemW [Planctomycetes bacterium]|nr:radical SAM family heme chaperone HemW [Planctomycetota bacterium]
MTPNTPSLSVPKGLPVARPPGLPLEAWTPRGLYVHLPFCARRCPYCEFAVTPLRQDVERRYLAALALEAERRIPPAWRPTTLYLGGGTPAELTGEGVSRLVQILGPAAQGAREVTLEANPRTLLARKLGPLVAGLGVTRLSLGAQSFQAKLLAGLGRFHRAEDVTRAAVLAREHGLALSLDLIFAVPGQTSADLERDLDATLALEPAHVSLYNLTFEPGTAFDKRRLAGELVPQPEERQAELFDLARERLKAAGFLHYEISNFGRPGQLSLHNRLYWRNAGYLGLGNSAASHLKGERLSNHRDVADYASALERGELPIAEREHLDPDAKVRETAYLALRTSEGIVPERFERDTGHDPRVFFAREFARLCEIGVLQDRAGRIQLSGRGVSLADAVARELL